jgi:hypothetical protein
MPPAYSLDDFMPFHRSFTPFLRFFLFPAVLCVAVFSGQALSAIEVRDLDQIEVPVENQSVAARNNAFQVAMGLVLIRLSGARDILEAPAVGPIVSDAARYVRGFSYLEKDAISSTARVSGAKQLFISVEFAGDALQKELRNAGLPVWSVNRPATLLWLAVREPGGRFILGEGSNNPVKQAVILAANRRGIPLILPLMDTEDSNRVAFGDISGGFDDSVLRASDRYNAPVVLIGFLDIDRSGQWAAKWTVLRENVSSGWQERGIDLQQAVDTGIDGLADILASRYAFGGGDGQLVEYVVAVERLISMDDYARVLNYLDELVLTEDVTPVRIESGHAYFRVLMRGSIQELERALGLMPGLKPVTGIPIQLPPLGQRQLRTQTTPGITDTLQAQLLSVRERADLYFTYFSR